MADNTKLAIAVAAGVGIGAAAAYLCVKKTTASAAPVVTKAPSVPVTTLQDSELRVKKPMSRSQSLRPETHPESPTTPDGTIGGSSHLPGHHLSTWQDDEAAHSAWPRPESQRKNLVVNPMFVARPHMNFLNPNEKVMGTILQNDSKAALRSHALDGGCIRGNACKHIWWEPKQVKAALVTCGGLCPGLNSIIQGVTNCLWRDYGVRTIVGITAGYNGLSDPEKHPSIELNPTVVETIHLDGGVAPWDLEL